MFSVIGKITKRILSGDIPREATKGGKPESKKSHKDKGSKKQKK